MILATNRGRTWIGYFPGLDWSICADLTTSQENENRILIIHRSYPFARLYLACGLGEKSLKRPLNERFCGNFQDLKYVRYWCSIIRGCRNFFPTHSLGSNPGPSCTLLAVQAVSHALTDSAMRFRTLKSILACIIK